MDILQSRKTQGESCLAVQPENLKKPLLKDIKTLGSIPLFSNSLTRLIEIEGDSKFSTHELSSIILDDYGLINKVLQTVNAFYYNRLGKEINTVTQAVVLLGFNTIKKIALSMAVLELLGGKGGKAAVSEIGKAFLAAHLSQEIGSKQKGMEPEEIFISTLFRHLARIAMAIGNSGLLAEVQRLESSSDNADRLKAKRIIRTLGHKLSEYWKLPRSLAGYLEGCGSTSGSANPSYRSLAKDVTNLVSMWEEGEAGTDFSLLKEKIIKRYGMASGGIEKMLQRALDETVRTIPKFGSAMKKETGSLSLDDPQGKNNELLKEDKDTELRGRLERETLFTGLIQNLMAAVNDMDTGLDQIYLLAIEILRRVINIENIVFCKITLDNSVFSACFGMGDQAGLIKHKLSFDLKNCPKELKNAFSMEKETVFCWKNLLESKNDIPESLLARPLLLAPLVIGRKNIGCLILDKQSGNRFEPEEIQKISIVRQLVVTATSLRAKKKTTG